MVLRTITLKLKTVVACAKWVTPTRLSVEINY